jgi:hypothetical protein
MKKCEFTDAEDDEELDEDAFNRIMENEKQIRLCLMILK